MVGSWYLSVATCKSTSLFIDGMEGIFEASTSRGEICFKILNSTRLQSKVEILTQLLNQVPEQKHTPN